MLSTNRSQSCSDRRVSPETSGPYPVSPSKLSTRRVNFPELSLRRHSARNLFPRHNSTGRRSPERGASFPWQFSLFSGISPSKDSGRLVSPSGTRSLSPFERTASPPGRTASPTGQSLISLFGWTASPPGQRRIFPFGRPASSAGQRRISPFGRTASPPAQRRNSPFGRSTSHDGRVSPKRDELRWTSPNIMKYDHYAEGYRRMTAQDSLARRYWSKWSPPRDAGRYSPTQHDDNDAGSMLTRRACERQAQAYTGAGSRLNEAQYPTHPWQRQNVVYPLEDAERANRRNKIRRSRSHSPGKYGYRRHSPTPCSPPRSWGLEEECSPEIHSSWLPMWAGQEESLKHPTWECNVVQKRFNDKQTNKFNNRVSRLSPKRDITQYTVKLDDYIEGLYRNSPLDLSKLFPEEDAEIADLYQRAVECNRKGEERKKANEHRTRFNGEDQGRDRSPLQARNNPSWIPVEPRNNVAEEDRNRIILLPEVRQKRDKASKEIASLILAPHNFSGEQKLRIQDELKISVSKLLLDMFKDEDVPNIGLVSKFRARYDSAEEEKILMDVLASMPTHYKHYLKRKSYDMKEVPANMSRPTPAYSDADAHGSAKLLHNSRKRTRDVRDDGDVKKVSTRTRKIIRTAARSCAARRGSRHEDTGKITPDVGAVKEKSIIAGDMVQAEDAKNVAPNEKPTEAAASTFGIASNINKDITPDNKVVVFKIPNKPAPKAAPKAVKNQSTKPIAKNETVTSKPSEMETDSKMSPIVPKAADKTPTETTKDDAKAEKNAVDFDELDDNDIQAMLNDCIVLDECSGSDEE